MHPLYKKLGGRLREARKSKGLTQQEVAERAGLTTAFISYLENGTRKGSLDAYLKISEALGMDPESLFQNHSAGAAIFANVEPTVSLGGLSAADSKMVKNMVRSLRRKK
jgi:transcriptional regulator with XRE-family HTH domain